MTTMSTSLPATRVPGVRRLAIFAYGAASYAIFFAVFVWAFLWTTNLFLPRTMDIGPTTSFSSALLVNVLLLALFAVQHSVMARPWFKKWLVRYIPAEIERSTYTLVSSLAMIVMFLFWQPIGGHLWHVDATAGRIALWALCGFGWLLVLISTCLINHFDLFGLRQVWLHLRGKPYQAIQFRENTLYRWVRHPIYVGWLIAFWATPSMSAAHLLFALLITAYVLVAIQFEERDMLAVHPEYAGYRKRAGMLLPRFGRSAGKVS